MQNARRLHIRSIAFPAISCGIYGFPIERAVTIAVREVREFLGKHDLPECVVFMCYSADHLARYERELAQA